MSFSDELIQQIKDKTNIVELVSGFVKLTRKGAYYFGVCPFHKEKTPSFSVNQQRQSFVCFGCGAHGDAIGFIERYKNLSFPEAVEYLALVTGVQIPNDSGAPADPEYINIKTLNKHLVERYERALTSNQAKIALEYLKQRHVDDSLRGIFHLGFCDDHSGKMYAELVKYGFSERTLNLAGIFNKRRMAMLTGRLIFPIFNKRGECVGFGGRTLREDDQAKYINSPETIVFKKKNILYNENLAFDERTTLVITEGYFDVISMYKAGLKSVVAPLGTAISDDQIKSAWRHSDTPTVAFDSDTAGQNAAFKMIDRILPLLSSNGKSFNFLEITGGKDLDEVINSGKEKPDELLKKAIPMKDMMLKKYMNSCDFSTPEGKALSISTIRSDTSKIPDPIVRGFYLDFLNTELFNKSPAKSMTATRRSAQIRKLSVKKADEKAMRYLFFSVLKRPELLENVLEKFAAINYLTGLRNTILTFYTDGEKDLLEKIKKTEYTEELAFVFSNDMSLHMAFVENAEIDELTRDWESVYYRHCVEKHEKEEISMELRNGFSSKKWQLLKYLKRTDA